ncbi:peptidase dimerization domain-containing protein, partial [Phascolarctobacterium faecium]|uniref:peptidase dimerization domain-containing protein n=1 Tax=Phascolarctobacterium faecium TaxID=33025 RepID=UPI001D096F74|nr:peptidase dimerization domain-containing protein [Phascolarctobacterium faecium]
MDTIVAGAQFLTAAQTIITRRVNPLYPAVLTFGKITGGTRYNVVADTVEIEGTCRTYHEEAQDAVETYLKDTLKGIDAMYGTESTLSYERGYA